MRKIPISFNEYLYARLVVGCGNDASKTTDAQSQVRLKDYNSLTLALRGLLLN